MGKYMKKDLQWLAQTDLQAQPHPAMITFLVLPQLATTYPFVHDLWVSE
jgi:hypothetical protein